MLRNREQGEPSPRLITQQELGYFSSLEGMPLSVELGAALRRSPQRIICFTTSAEKTAADRYGWLLGRHDDQFEVVEVTDPIKAVQSVTDPEVIPLIISSAVDPHLRVKMFSQPNLGQLFADEVYVEDSLHRTQLPYCIGIAKQGLALLAAVPKFHDDHQRLLLERCGLNQAFLSNERTMYGQFRALLQSSRVHLIRVHALGPDGTNISQVARQYVSQHKLNYKTEIVIHPAGVEPLEYAAIARQEVAEGIVPLHIECAVFYDMPHLYRERSALGEVVFADHHHMALDNMQLAGQPGENLSQVLRRVNRYLTLGRQVVIATHPSPRPLISEWEQQGVKWVKAPSNSAAAEMVCDGDADLCVTTQSALTKNNLQMLHEFGSPNMFFNIGTSLTHQELLEYQT